MKPLTSEDFIYSLLSEKDKDFYYQLFSDQEVMRWIDLPWSQEQSNTALSTIIRQNKSKANNHKLWVVNCNTSGANIGVIGLSKIGAEEGKRDIGIMLSPSFQKKGAAQEIMNRIMDYGREALGLTAITCKIHSDHSACIRLAKRLNFKLLDKSEKWGYWEKELGI